MPGNYITRLPKADHEAKEWQAAMESLILVATPYDSSRIFGKSLTRTNPS